MLYSPHLLQYSKVTVAVVPADLCRSAYYRRKSSLVRIARSVEQIVLGCLPRCSLVSVYTRTTARSRTWVRGASNCKESCTSRRRDYALLHSRDIATRTQPPLLTPATPPPAAYKARTPAPLLLLRLHPH